MERSMEIYMTAGIGADVDADKNFAGAIAHILHRFLNNDWGNLYMTTIGANVLYY